MHSAHLHERVTPDVEALAAELHRSAGDPQKDHAVVLEHLHATDCTWQIAQTEQQQQQDRGARPLRCDQSRGTCTFIRRISSSDIVPYGNSMWMSHGGSAMITCATRGRDAEQAVISWQSATSSAHRELAEDLERECADVAVDELRAVMARELVVRGGVARDARERVELRRALPHPLRVVGVDLWWRIRFLVWRWKRSRERHRWRRRMHNG